MLHACRPAIGLPYRPYCIAIERCVGHTDHGMTICLSHNKHGHIDRLLPVPYIDRLLPVPYIERLLPVPYIDRLLPVPYIDRRLPVPYIDTLLADRRNAIAFRFTPTSCVPKNAGDSLSRHRDKGVTQRYGFQVMPDLFIYKWNKIAHFWRHNHFYFQLHHSNSDPPPFYEVKPTFLDTAPILRHKQSSSSFLSFHQESCPLNCALPMPGTADGDVVSRCQVLGRAGSVHHGADQ